MLLAPTIPLTLAEVQALRPPAGDAGSLRTAIAQAEAAREAALDRAEAIEIHMAAAIPHRVGRGTRARRARGQHGQSPAEIDALFIAASTIEA